MATFPGLSRDKTLVLPIPRAVWVPPARGVVLDGIAFEPKTELHVTLIGSALGARIASGGLDEHEVRAIFESLDWTYTRTGQYRLLAKDKPGTDGAAMCARSIVERIELPAMAAFHRALAAQLGIEPTVPPPHVTLWVAGDREGIGVPSEAELERLTVRNVDPAELEGARAGRG